MGLVTCLSRPSWAIFAILVMTSLSPAAVCADTTYTIQPVLKLRDTLGDTPIRASEAFEIGTLNDRGQLSFGTYTTTTWSTTWSQAKFLWDNGKFTPILLPQGEAPVGKWPRRLDTWAPVSMNQSGNAVFAVVDIARAFTGSPPWLGTFLWDHQAQTVTPIALNGMQAVSDLTFSQAGGFRPVINNMNEIALVGQVRNAAGRTLGEGVFFHGLDGTVQPVALPGQDLPGGGKVQGAFAPTLNDAGRIGFLATRQGQDGANAYLWERGTLSPLAQIDTAVSGAGRIVEVLDAFVNDKDRSVLIAARLHTADTGPVALLRFSDGKLSPVVVPGQEMPGGGKLARLGGPVSFGNTVGQHAFYALLEGGFTAAYLLDADGRLSLILKSGTATGLGRVAAVGSPAEISYGIGLNNRGQVALALKIDTLPPMIALMTPVAP